MDRIFAVDFKKLVVNLMPPFIHVGMIKVVQVFIAGVRSIHVMFLSMRNDHKIDLNITPQVFSIRKALNDYFDAGERRIRIEDGDIYERTFIFTSGEQRPLFLGGKTIYTAQELKTGTGFVVIVPEVLNNNGETARLRAMLNKYKLAGTKYTIRYE